MCSVRNIDVLDEKCLWVQKRTIILVKSYMVFKFWVQNQRFEASQLFFFWVIFLLIS